MITRYYKTVSSSNKALFDDELNGAIESAHGNGFRRVSVQFQMSDNCYSALIEFVRDYGLAADPQLLDH